MTDEPDDDAVMIMRRLGDLPLMTPDREREARVRARCRKRLERRDRKGSQLASQMLILALGAIYVSAAIDYYVELRGLL